MTCREARRLAGVTAGTLWVAAVVTAAFCLEDDGMTNVVLLLVASAAAATVIAGVGFILSKGSAEAVFEMGRRAGYQEALEEARDAERAVVGGGSVSFLGERRR